MIKPSNDDMPAPKEPLIEIVLSMSTGKRGMDYEMKLITKHEVVKKYSDVFTKNINRLISDCPDYSY
jgi:hypothetical protein